MHHEILTALYEFLTSLLVIIAIASGIFILGYQWRKLLHAYGTSDKLKFSFKYRTVMIGFISFRGCMNIAVLDEGLYLKVSFPFNLIGVWGALFIPWSQIHYKKRILGIFPYFYYMITPEKIGLTLSAEIAQKAQKFVPIAP